MILNIVLAKKNKFKWYNLELIKEKYYFNVIIKYIFFYIYIFYFILL